MSTRRRLGAQDALWLEMDRPGNLMMVDSLFWTAEPIDWDRYCELTRERLWDRYPVFRSVVVQDEEGGWCWEERPGLPFEDRLERVVLPDPGGDAELQDLIASQRTVALDRDQPLWRAFLVDGYHGGSAVLFRAHHAIADGIRMVQLVLSVFDVSPEAVLDASPGTALDEAREAAPDGDADARPDAHPLTLPGQLAREAVTNPVGAAHTALARTTSLAGSVRSGVRSTVRVPGVLTSAVAGVPGDVDTARKLILGTRNDATGWTGTVGDRKAITWSAPIPLDAVKATARAHSATVNDVLLACVADTLRAYLHRHGAVCSSVTWDVPVNLKPFDPSLPVELGNSFALVQLELPTDIDDPLRTLEVVRRRMARIKRGHEAVVDFGVQAAFSRLGGRLYRAVIDLMANRAVGVLTNVPGPQVPLHVVGRKVEGMMGWAPLSGDQAMSLTIYSYDGKVFVGLAADAGLVPHHEEIVEGFEEAFHRLRLLTTFRLR